MTSRRFDIVSLRDRVHDRLSEKRFRHTLGVEQACRHIGEKCLPDSVDELCVAALLHDVTKEYSVAEQLNIMKNQIVDLSDDDISTEAAYHSLTAPYVIERDFSEYATDRVLSAVRNHTLASPDMSVFDEIVFIADFVEEGRTYSACVSLREKLYGELDMARDVNAAIAALHRATLDCLDFTIRFVTDRGYFLHGKTAMARDAFLGRTD